MGSRNEVKRVHSVSGELETGNSHDGGGRVFIKSLGAYWRLYIYGRR